MSETQNRISDEAQAPAVPDDDILKRLDRAHRIVAGIHSGSVKIRMSIPAAPDRDTDLVACAAIRDAKAEIASLRENLAKYKNIADAVKGYTEYMNADGLISAFIKEQERLRDELTALRACGRDTERETGMSEQIQNRISDERLAEMISEMEQEIARWPEEHKAKAHEIFDDDLSVLCELQQARGELAALREQNKVIYDLVKGIVEEYSPCVIDESHIQREWCATQQTKRCGQKTFYDAGMNASTVSR